MTDRPNEFLNVLYKIEFRNGLEMYCTKRNSVSSHVVAICSDTRVTLFWAWKRRVIVLRCADQTINSFRPQSKPTSSLTVFQQPCNGKLENSGYYYCCTCEPPGWHFLSSVYLLHVLYIISTRRMERMLKCAVIHSSYIFKTQLDFFMPRIKCCYTYVYWTVHLFHNWRIKTN